MEYTLTTAAKASGIGRSTLHRAIKSGRLSARRLDDGSYRIDPAELARAFPPEPSGPSPWDAGGQGGSSPGEAGAATAAEMAELRHRLEMAEALLTREREAVEREQETVSDLRKRLDAAEERVRLLMPPHPAATAAPISTTTTAEPVPPSSPVTRARLLRRWFGRGAR